ncbi:MAG: PAS domain S-box protein [Deltaproteobacteria bacterium]|nr:PAS domain S-box protein [Deltaproteobacteria bacterium]
MGPTQSSPPLRILLVEDDKHDRLAFHRAFQRSQVSCEITECEKAEEALEPLRSDASLFDLVVIDHGLPGISGLDLCKELIDEGIPLPMVLLTGRGSEELAVEALKVGVNDYIIKDSGMGYLDLMPAVLPEVVRKHGDRVARERAESSLRESEERFRNIVEGSEAGYCFIDRDGRFMDVNEAWLRMHGYSSRDKVIGKHLALTQVDEHMDQAQEDFENLLAGDSIPSGESVRRLKDGSLGYHTFSANPVLQGGKIVGVESFLIDITERKRAEEKLRKMNEELTNFAHVVSHDLKTPIVYIKGFSSLLLERYKDELDEKGQTCVERIQTSAHRMEILVSDLLALSRVGRVVSTLKDVPSHEIIATVTSGLQDRLNETGIKLVVADNLPTICCDRERVCQVFENLMVNAIKFMGDNKNPTIEIGFKERAKRAEFHQFYVKDNGIGIAPEDHRKIFERFRRLKEIDDQEGTGLGLAIVERIVNNHGGRVWVESEKGKGATFHFTLPKAS